MAKQHETRVGHMTDLADGALHNVTIGDTTLVLARIGAKVYALANECPHQGGPLAEGLLCGTRLLCPWHHACFDVTNGTLVEPPALDDLACYTVRIAADGTIYVADALPAAKAAAPATNDGRTFVMLGGGAAGIACARELRAKGFAGQIVVLDREPDAPVDRTMLSKEYLNDEAERDELFLCKDDWYTSAHIDLQTKRTVTAVDFVQRTVRFADGTTLDYDALLLAPGSIPRTLDVPGADLGGVRLLRTLADADRLLKDAKTATRVVVVGSSFIAMEVAAGLTQRGLHVTVVGPETVPFAKVLGKELGQLYIDLHTSHGVTFQLGKEVARFEGSASVERVVLTNGTTLDADLVVVGVGVQPATAGIAGLPTADDGSVTVDATFKLADGVYAAGDIARFPAAPNDAHVRVEHWRVAEQQGQRVAAAMLGLPVMPLVPFFWTNQYDLSVQYVGHASTWDETIVWGDMQERTFVCFYVAGDQVLAVAASNRDRELDAVEELMRCDRMPPASDLRNGPFSLAERLAAA